MTPQAAPAMAVAQQPERAPAAAQTARRVPRSCGARYLHGVRWTLLTNLFGSSFAALSAILIARLLDPAGYGSYRTIIYLGSLCAAVAGFELRDAMRRFIPTLRIHSPEQAASAVLAAGLIVAALSVLMAAGLFCFAGPVTLALYKQPALTGLVRWAGLLVAAMAAAATMEAALTGFELYSAATLRNLLAQAVGIPLQIVLAWRLGVAGALAGFVLVAAGRAILLGAAVLRACQTYATLGSVLRPLLPITRRLLGFSLPLLVTALLIPFANWWLSSRLAVTAGMSQVGLFAVAYGVTQMLTTLALAAGVPLMPVLAEASAAADHETLSRMVARAAVIITLLLFVPAFVVGAHARAVILLLYGHRFAAATPVLFQFALGCLPLGINESLSRSAVATGHVRLTVGSHLVWLATILSAVEFYGRQHGALGCAQCFVAAEFCQTFYLGAMAHLYLRFDMRGIARLLIVCAAAMVPAYYLSSHLTAWSVAAFAATAAVVFTALWKWSLTEPDRRLVAGRLASAGLWPPAWTLAKSA